MSNATNDTGDIIILRYNLISQYITKYVGVCLYILCLFGTTMNVSTFLKRKYKRLACSLYLLAASVCDVIHLNFGSLSNILQYGFDYNWAITSLKYCKGKNYITYVFTVISATFTVIAGIDRYVTSSRKIRRWRFSTQTVALRCITLVILFWLILSIPIVFCSVRINHQSHNEQMICAIESRQPSCFYIQIIYNCILNGFVPPIGLLYFGFLTFLNGRRLRQRCLVDSKLMRRINYQLASMLVLQAVKSSFASLPFATFNSYFLLTVDLEKSQLYQARENLVHQIVYLLFWSNYTSFFVYFYSSDIFRNQWLAHIKTSFCCSPPVRTRKQLKHALA